MVYQTSGTTIPFNCESTSRRTFRELPLTIRNGLGVFDKLLNQIFPVRGESGEVSKAREFSRMQRTFARALRSIGFEERKLPSDKPILLESAEEQALDQDHTETEDNSWILQEDLERIKPSKQQSNHRLLWLAIVACFILIFALFLGLLILSGKIGHECGCSGKNGPQQLKSQTPEKENATSISELSLKIENLRSAMNDVNATVDGTKNDLAKLKRTTTTLKHFNTSLNQVNFKLRRTSNDLSELYGTVIKLENYNSSFNEVKSNLERSRINLSQLSSTVIEVQSTLNSTSNDLSDLKSSVTKVQSRSDRTSADVSALNYTVNKLNKAIQRNLNESCQSLTWNSTREECKFNCCCAANSCEETPPAVESCKELYNTNGSYANRAYPLRLGKKIFPVYCHMTALDGCGGGGWTLVMKMDGSKDTFHYNQLIWSNALDYNPSAGKTGFDGEETMLPSYWETKFSRICLGMKNGKEINFIAINMTASSLYSLIADGQYRPTSLGRDIWKSLLRSNASLQYNCNREGFNALCAGSGAVQPRARIGILGNEQYDCNSCDSRIGFGTGGSPDYSNSCGNVAVHKWGADNGEKNIKTMGYILVQ